MLVPKHILLPLLSLGSVNALDLDTSKAESIRATAKTLAGGLAAAYTKFQGNGGQAPGLFNDDAGDTGNYWYQFGQAWSSLIAYANLTADSQYNDIITKGLVHQIGDFGAFMPPNQTKTLGNEDQAAWGLAALTAAENGLKDPENIKWLDLAKNVFDTQTLRWDDKTCGGGHKWQIFTFNAGYNYKNTVTNGAYFLLSARLAVLTGNKTFTEWAEKSYDWAAKVKLVDNFAVFDGADDRTNCSQVNKLQWTVAHGLYVEGAAALFNATKGEQKWRDTLSGLVKHSSVFRSNSSNVLFEPACERSGKCDTGMRSYKGQYARNLARAASFAPFIANDIRPTLQASAKAAAAACSGEGDNLKCSSQWATTGESKTVSVDGLSEGYSALEAVQALLYAEPRIAGNSTQNPSPAQSGTPTGTGNPAAHTGGASEMAVAWGSVGIAGVIAVFGLL